MEKVRELLLYIETKYLHDMPMPIISFSTRGHCLSNLLYYLDSVGFIKEQNIKRNALKVKNNYEILKFCEKLLMEDKGNATYYVGLYLDIKYLSKKINNLSSDENFLNDQLLFALMKNI